MKTSITSVCYPWQLNRTALYPHEKVTRWCADFLGEPLPGTYDCVTSFQVIEHLEEPEPYFLAAKNLCKPGGYVAVVTPNWNRLSNLFLRLRGKAAVLCDSQHFTEYTRGMLRKIGEESDLEYIDFFGCNLAGFKFIDKHNMKKKLSWGKLFPSVAQTIGIIFRKK